MSCKLIVTLFLASLSANVAFATSQRSMTVYVCDDTASLQGSYQIRVYIEKNILPLDHPHLISAYFTELEINMIDLQKLLVLPAEEIEKGRSSNLIFSVPMKENPTRKQALSYFSNQEKKAALTIYPVIDKSFIFMLNWVVRGRGNNLNCEIIQEQQRLF